MKKILSLTLAVLMLLSLTFAFASCGDKEDTLVCGVTIIPGLNEQVNGEWTGFESEFAMEVGKLIGMKVEFQEIDWGQKYMELEAGTIDCIWNGFTANSTDKIDGVETKRSDLVDFSYGYMLNQQCVVIKVDNKDTIKSEADLAGKKIGVENGSAGESYAADVIGENGSLEKYPAQNKAFLEQTVGHVDGEVTTQLRYRRKQEQGQQQQQQRPQQDPKALSVEEPQQPRQPAGFVKIQTHIGRRQFKVRLFLQPLGAHLLAQELPAVFDGFHLVPGQCFGSAGSFKWPLLLPSHRVGGFNNIFFQLSHGLHLSCQRVP
ncbi:MAG: transporter substrate-binding domain-containing protein, partial [Oscillospiraceae bacterium]|nr:transporter substrate-binding domain-containing protein [Oscillospiraceae bacterium]